jgi:drug/metabolite transporter (DMT)-like permease
VVIGGLALAAWFAWTGFDAQWRRHWRYYAVIGALSSALPFWLFSSAGLHLEAWLMAILNATTPMFGLVLGALFAGERLSWARIAGLALGICGVTLLALPAEAAAGAHGGGELWAVAACLVASLSYAVGGVLVKRYGSGVPPRGVAVGAQLSAALMLAPFLPFELPASAPSPLIVANLLAFGILASGIALILYFRLMADIGPTRALTVTFLIPLFAALWRGSYRRRHPGARRHGARHARLAATHPGFVTARSSDRVRAWTTGEGRNRASGRGAAPASTCCPTCSRPQRCSRASTPS